MRSLIGPYHLYLLYSVCQASPELRRCCGRERRRVSSTGGCLRAKRGKQHPVWTCSSTTPALPSETTRGKGCLFDLVCNIRDKVARHPGNPIHQTSIPCKGFVIGHWGVARAKGGAESFLKCGAAKQRHSTGSRSPYCAPELSSTSKPVACNSIELIDP